MIITKTIYTEGGFWNPIVWLITIFILYIIFYLFYISGKKEYQRGTDQVRPYLSGNVEYDNEILRIKSSNMYWGFTKTLSNYYKRLAEIHTSNVSDYVSWFVAIMVLVFFIVIFL